MNPNKPPSIINKRKPNKLDKEEILKRKKKGKNIYIWLQRLLADLSSRRNKASSLIKKLSLKHEGRLLGVGVQAYNSSTWEAVAEE